MLCINVSLPCTSCASTYLCLVQAVHQRISALYKLHKTDRCYIIHKPLSNELSTVPAAAIPVSGEDEYVCDVMSPVLGVL